jgi:hypothetical protein
MSGSKECSFKYITLNNSIGDFQYVLGVYDDYFAYMFAMLKMFWITEKIVDDAWIEKHNFAKHEKNFVAIPIQHAEI